MNRKLKALTVGIAALFTLVTLSTFAHAGWYKGRHYRNSHRKSLGFNIALGIGLGFRVPTYNYAPVYRNTYRTYRTYKRVRSYDYEELGERGYRDGLKDGYNKARYRSRGYDRYSRYSNHYDRRLAKYKIYREAYKDGYRDGLRKARHKRHYRRY